MNAEINKKKKSKRNQPDYQMKTGKWSKVFFYFLVLIAAILVVTSVFLVVSGN